ncbi:MAG TPA: ribonuclease Y [Tissierellia bacterium]|nr:ribonuclease Y [Tissierellia bacterium]
MSGQITQILVPLLAALIGIVLGYFLRKSIAEGKLKSAEDQANHILLEARKAAETTKKEKLFEAKEEIHSLRTNLEKETRERNNLLQRSERRIIQKEEALDAKQREQDKKDKDQQAHAKKLSAMESTLQQKLDAQHKELERVAAMSREDAKAVLLEEVDKKLDREKVQRIRDMEEDIRENAVRNSQRILANTIHRIASDFVSESTVSVVSLPNEEMKGRIIGREGRNIRALEKETGVDLIIDDTPEAVVLSCFDPVRREITRLALEKLITDGRIHPSRIEEMVNKSRQEVDEKMKEEGKNAIFELELSRVHPELVKMIGRLQFRTSYGQNVLKHAIEVAKIAGMLAKELGANVRIAKRAGLFHDIGKAIDTDQEGTHIELGMQLLKKFGESDEVIHAMSTHHGDYEPETIEAVIVTAADAISAARPGARRESLNNYIKRLENLEAIADSYDGVEKSFAIQAGREVRVMVMPDKVNDDRMVLLAREISQRIEDEMDYPGQVKVHIIRESRVVDYAK